MPTFQLAHVKRAVCLLAIVHFGIFADANVSYSQDMHYLNGDPIGIDSSTTDNTGGFTAVQHQSQNMGQPAILVTLDGSEQLAEFRVIVFGLATAADELRFDEFDYHLDVWQSSGYFAGSEPLYQIDLGQPTDVQLVPEDADVVVPASNFGTAGANSPTYDFRFDLSELPGPNPIEDPLPAGDWVFGFQSWHDTQESGILRVSAAFADDGPTPLFSRDNFAPRGVLGGQDPSSIAVYWGISLAAIADSQSDLSGDFNRDGVVDAADYVVWRRAMSVPTKDKLGHDYNGDGSIDAADYVIWRKFYSSGASESYLNYAGDGLNGVDAGDHLLWQSRFGSNSDSSPSGIAQARIAEPATVIPMIVASGAFFFITARRLGDPLRSNRPEWI